MECVISGYNSKSTETVEVVNGDAKVAVEVVGPPSNDTIEVIELDDDDDDEEEDEDHYKTKDAKTVVNHPGPPEVKVEITQSKK